MSRTARITLLAAATVAGLFLLLIGAFAIDRAVHSGSVLHHVAVASVDLSGMAPDEARNALLSYEDALATTTATFTVAGTEVDLEPTAVGFDLDEDRALALAMDEGRSGDLAEQFGFWLSHVFGWSELPIAGSLNESELDRVFDSWDADVVADPPFPGAVEVRNLRPVAVYPHPGTGIDRDAARPLILDTLLQKSRPVVSLPTAELPSPITDADVDAAVSQAVDLITGPIVLAIDDPPLSVSFSPDELASALTSTVVTNSPPKIVVEFDPEIVADIIEPYTANLVIPPVDATFEIDEDEQVTVVPSHPGKVVDPGKTAEALLAAAQRPDRTGTLPFQDDAEPEFTTEDAEALDIRHLVSQFTTYHSCCQNRVTNIHLFADYVDGAIVPPGEQLSLNEYVGERTTERGFLPDHTIIQGKLVDTVGGGVSQFATTFYNALYFGGYEDIVHQPHSYYFSRYPEGHEATISWPAPNLIFKNDSESGILIKTEYTDTSLTVKFYGNNGGRTMVGEQKGGRLHVEVVNEGDATARKVTSKVSGRFDETDPPTEYIPNPELAPGEEIVDVKGRVGWTVIVTRSIEYPDGHIETQTWRVRYRPQPREVQVHPCMIPPEEGEEPVECPTTTTTTDSTTTTTEATTTTTAAGG